MLTLVISFSIGAFCAWAVGLDHGTTAGVVSGLIAMVIFQLIAGLVMRRIITREQNNIQNILLEAQNKINRQINMYQKRPPSSTNAARQALEKIQNEAARKALAATDNFKKFYLWNFMLKRQINTMKMQLLFQLGEYKKVDEILPKCFIIDQQSLAIKLTRLYRNNDEKLDSFYRKRCSRAKGEARAFLACVYGWMKVRQEQPEKALEALNNAKKVSDHPSLIDNIEHLANGRNRHFSNSGFGDAWYALGLEEPKVKAQRQQRGRMF